MNKSKFFLFKFFTVFIFLSFFSNISFSIEPEKFIQDTVNEASLILIKGGNKNEKIIKLRDIAKKTVDIKGIAFYTLGSHRKSISDNQKKIYLELFEEYFLRTFSSRLAEYSDPKINVNSQKKLNENYTIVSSTLIGTDERPEIKIGWRVYTKNPDKPLIRDLIIEGLSLARAQKEEFNSIIQSNDSKMEALLSTMRDFNNKID